MPAAPLQALFTSLRVAFMLCRHYFRLVRLSFYLPFFLYDALTNWIKTAQRRRRIEATRDAYTPRPLPAKRSRALSNAGSKQRQHDQYHSPLFSKLPAELRLPIYMHVLTAPRIIHLGIWNKTYWHRICKEHPAHLVLGASYLHECWAEPRIAGDERLHRSGDPLHLHTNETTSDHLLALPLTCKRVYAEAIDLLYSANTFNVHRTGTIAHLPRSLIPQRLEQIRTLQLDVPITRFMSGSSTDMVVHIDDAQQWRTACEVLRGMKGLRSLVISLSIIGLHSWSSSVVHWFVAPLMDIRVEHFEVCLPHVLGDAETAGFGALPFQVIYYDEEEGLKIMEILQQGLRRWLQHGMELVTL